MKKPLPYIIFLLLIGFYACKTDIDVNAEPKDITVVYGLIDPNDSTHYIKINKAFLGDANAFDLAADANNSNYADGDLTVSVHEYNGTNLIKSYLLTRTVNEIPKETGIFDNSENVLYKFNEPAINKNNTYKLSILNTKLNKEITAETEIVEDIQISAPPTGTKFNFKNNLGKFIDKKISVTTAEDVARVKGVLVFNYIESYNNGDSPVSMSVKMGIGDEKSTTSNGGEKLEFSMKGETFFSNIESSIDPNTPNLFKRDIVGISMEFTVVGTELSTFIDVSTPSNSVVQIKPAYTNIDNGLGIFSSRTTYTWVTSLFSPQRNIGDDTITALQGLGLFLN